MAKDSNISKVKLYGQPNSASAYEIRDFFKRSVVEFYWIELTCAVTFVHKYLEETK